MDATGVGRFLRGYINEIQYGTRTAEAIASDMAEVKLQPPIDVATDNMGVFTALRATEVNVPEEKHLLYQLRAIRDRLDIRQTRSLWWQDTRDMFSDGLTKGGVDRETILKIWRTGIWELIGDAPVVWSAKVAERNEATAIAGSHGKTIPPPPLTATDNLSI